MLSSWLDIVGLTANVGVMSPACPAQSAGMQHLWAAQQAVLSL